MPTVHGRCANVAWTLCVPTVCQVLIVCQCCVDVGQSTYEMCADVVWTLCGRFVVKKPTSRFFFSQEIAAGPPESVQINCESLELDV